MPESSGQLYRESTIIYNSGGAHLVNTLVSQGIEVDIDNSWLDWKGGFGQSLGAPLDDSEWAQSW